jgi:hypothetical protein
MEYTLTESSRLLIGFLVTSIALLSALLVLILIKRLRNSDRPLTDLIRGAYGRAKGPLRSLAIVIAFLVFLDYILPTEVMSSSAQAVFLAVFCALAIVPPWLPARLFAIATAAFFVTSAAAFTRLLPAGAEGPDVMAVSLLLLLLNLLFLASCAAKAICKAIGLHAKWRSKT